MLLIDMQELTIDCNINVDESDKIIPYIQEPMCLEDCEKYLENEFLAQDVTNILMQKYRYYDVELFTEIAVERFPDNTYFMGALVKSLIFQGNFKKDDKAKRYIENSIEKYKHQINSLTEEINILNFQGINTNILLKRLKNIAKADLHLRSLLLTLLLRKKFYKEVQQLGTESLGLYLNIFPYKEVIKGKVIEAYIKDNKPDEAIKLIRSSSFLPDEAFEDENAKKYNRKIRISQLKIASNLLEDKTNDNSFLEKRDNSVLDKLERLELTTNIEASLFLNISNSIHNTSNIDRIINKLKELLSATPNDIFATFLLIEAYFKKGMTESMMKAEALKLCKSAISTLKSNDPNSQSLKIFNQLLQLLITEKMLPGIRKDKVAELANKLVKQISL